jgi:hypothetical protein
VPCFTVLHAVRATEAAEGEVSVTLQNACRNPSGPQLLRGSKLPAQQQPLFARFVAAVLMLFSWTPEPGPLAEGLSACESLSLTITSLAIEWNTWGAQKSAHVNKPHEE